MGSDPYGGYEGYLDHLGLYNTEEIRCINGVLCNLRSQLITIPKSEFDNGWNAGINKLITLYEESLKEDKIKHNTLNKIN